MRAWMSIFFEKNKSGSGRKKERKIGENNRRNRNDIHLSTENLYPNTHSTTGDSVYAQILTSVKPKKKRTMVTQCINYVISNGNLLAPQQ